jgi:RNA polymerase sigma factor (sigma-70 family)
MNDLEPFEWAELLSRLRPRFEGILFRFRIPLEEAEDLVQDALVAATRHWTVIQDPEAWLVQTLKSMCIGFWRRRVRRRWILQMDFQILEEIAPPVPPAQERRELLLDLETLLAVLPPRSRRLMILRYQLGLSVEEIATELGYRPASIRKISARVLDRLRRSWQEQIAESSEGEPESRKEVV